MPSAETSGDVAVISARPVFRISGGSLSPRASSGLVAPCDRPVERVHPFGRPWLVKRPPPHPRHRAPPRATGAAAPSSVPDT
eukprot:scaffold13035_cov61-Phaeocystis_antarctica.AAC.1